MPKMPTKAAIQRARNRAHILFQAAALLEGMNTDLATQVNTEAEKARKWADDAEKVRGQ